MSSTPRTDALINEPSDILFAHACQLERELASRPEGVALEELAKRCERIGNDYYQKIGATHGEQIAWSAAAVACAHAIRALKSQP